MAHIRQKSIFGLRFSFSHRLLVTKIYLPPFDFADIPQTAQHMGNLPLGIAFLHDEPQLLPITTFQLILCYQCILMSQLISQLP